jgi:hypothetical protein
MPTDPGDEHSGKPPTYAKKKFWWENFFRIGTLAKGSRPTNRRKLDSFLNPKTGNGTESKARLSWRLAVRVLRYVVIQCHLSKLWNLTQIDGHNICEFWDAIERNIAIR